MQSVSEFLSELSDRDIQLYLKGDRLHCNAPKGKLTSALHKRISERKGEILTFLQQFDSDDDLNQICQPLPQIVSNSKERYQPFPLTEIQQAYLIGRNDSFDLSNVSTHVYAEIDVINLDLEKFERAWQHLIQRHEMMRAVMNSDGQQQILEQVPDYQIEVLDLRTEKPEVATAQLAALRDRLSHQLLPTDTWPLFEVRAAFLDKSTTRLFISIDLLIADAWSLEIIIRELVDYLNKPQSSQPSLELSFRDYVLAEIDLRNSAIYQRSQRYWQSRIASLPPSPELPLGKSLSAVKYPRFVHRTKKIAPEAWQSLRNRGFQANLTPSSIILAAFSEVLTAWSKSPQFTLNITLFKRLPLHSEVNRLVGDFTSLDLLAVDNSGTESFATRAKKIQRQLWQDLDHRYVSGMTVLRELARSQQRYSGALMPVVYTSTLTNDSLNRDRFANSSSTESASIYELGEVVYSLSQTPQIYLDHQVLEEQGALILNWDAIDEVFPPGLLEEMFVAYGDFVEALATREELWQANHLQIMEQLLPKQQLQQLATVNNTEIEARSHTPLLHSLFFERAALSATKTAVIAGDRYAPRQERDRTLTYQELSDRAGQLGRQLRNLGVTPNQLVAVVMERGWEQIVAVLGILASGAAYVPIDPDLPRERRWYLLEQTEVEVVITQPRLDLSLEWLEKIKRICVDVPSGNYSEPLEPIQKPEDLAYVIYTSGSTGTPKGVAIEHGSVVNTILDINQRFHVDEGDRTLALSALSFDLSVYDIFGTLAAGGTIVIPDAADSKDPAHWAELITKYKITFWNSVPALMQMLVEYSQLHPEIVMDSLRLVLLSGDWIPLNLPNEVRNIADQVEIVSLGGATEASIWSILYPIAEIEPSWKSIPYGKPMANQRFYVLNEMLASCPVWVTGTLYIGGRGLARGYWRDREKTNKSFIIHPLTGERLYNTGDLGYYLPDGNIVFLGRSDLQVKVQGYRIELGEIETALEQLPTVKQAVVQARGEQQSTKQLVAYLVLSPSSDQTTVTAAELSQQLKQKLPDYMVPSRFVYLDNFPLTPNGKIDRKALPEPLKEVIPPQQLASQSNSVTEQISELVASVLNLDNVDPNTNLLDLGANSVDIARIANLIEKQFQYRLQIKDLYRLSSVGALAKNYDEHLLKETSYQGERKESSFAILFDPEQRQQFKNRRLGLRQGDFAKVQLLAPEFNDDLKRSYLTRSSCRKFSQKTLTFEQFSQFLSSWRQLLVNGQPKSRYASAGGLYPVQPYLYIKPDRIEGLTAGTYYYHPLQHQLLALTIDAEIDRSIHTFNNQAIFDESAFSIFLLGQLAAIAPLYGELSRDFCLLEAGLMSQLLDLAAPKSQIGLCQIGSCDFERVRHLFVLEDSHIYLYCLLGGLEPQVQSFDLDCVTTNDDWEEGTL
jgi:pyochelin synthetase